MKNKLNHHKNAKIIIVFSMIIVLSGFLLITTITHGHNWGGDFSAYIMQCKSILEGNIQSYLTSNQYTIEQSSAPMGPIAYPWGFPLLLTPVFAFFGNNIYVLKFLGLILYLLLLIALWSIFRKTHTGIGFILLVSLFAFNPTMLSFVNNVLSDLPFLLVSTIGAWLIQRIVVGNKIISSSIWELIFLGIIIAFAFAIRTNGLLLLGVLGLSYLMFFLYQKGNGTFSDFTKWKYLFWALLPFITFFLFQLIWKTYFPSGGGSHLELLKKVSVSSINGNIHYYIELLSTFFPIKHSLVIFGITMPLLVIGMFNRYRSDYPYIIYILLTLLLYIIWPYKQGLRFLFPILPFYISFIISGYEILIGNIEIKKKYILYILYLPIVLLLVSFLSKDIDRMKNNLKKYTDIKSGPYSLKSQELFSFVRDYTEKNSTIIFFKPRVMRLFTNRNTIMISNPEQLNRGKYLCLRKIRGYKNINKKVEYMQSKGQAELKFENRDFKVYKLRIKEENK